MILNAFLSAISQTLLKKSANINYNKFILQYLNVYVILGYMIFFIVLFINIYVIKKLNLSIVSVFSESLPYILSIISGYIFFKEKITKNKIVGALIIVIGIILMV